MEKEIEYDPNTPLISDSYADWQISFLENFQKLFNAFEANHVALNATSNAGNHTIIQLFQQDNPQQTNQGEISVYTKSDASTTDQLFMRYQGNGTEFQISPYQIYTLINPGTYFTFLPGRIICYFGIYNYSTAPGQGSFKILELFPQVAKNIASVNFTAISNSPGVLTCPPYNNIVVDGIITGLTVFATTNQYYMVLANV